MNIFDNFVTNILEGNPGFALHVLSSCSNFCSHKKRVVSIDFYRQ